MKRILLTLLIATVSITFGYTQNEGLVPDHLEYLALKDLYTNTLGDTWSNHANWPVSWPATATSAEFATWAGVGVSNGDVTSLQLGYNNLQGSLPSSLGNLTQLVYVGVNSNGLTGGIPTAMFSNAHNLQYFYVDHNQFSGPLPAWSGADFPYLQYLNVSFNQFSGTIPASYATLSLLALLDVTNNQLTYFPPEFGSMTWLYELHLSGNPFPAGPVPSWIGQMTGLNVLLMAGNNFTGTLPTWLGNLHQLDYLSLNSNNFTGHIPAELNQCTSLTVLDLLNNQLDDLSTDLRGLTQLGYLGLSNNQFKGAIPEWLGHLPALRQLYMNGNQFTRFPASFSELTNLTHLYIQDNQLKGSLPDVSKMPNLSVVNVANNQLSGVLPASLSGRNIYILDISHNQFTGQFPSISNWTVLYSFSITGNHFNGAFPSAAGLNKLEYLEATGNEFSSIPASLLSLPKLGYTSFEANKLTGIDDLETEAAANHIHPGSGFYLFLDQNYLDFKTIGILGSLGVAGVPQLAFPQREINSSKKIGFNINSSLIISSYPVQSTTSVVWEKKINGAWTDVTASTQDASHQIFQLNTATQQDAGTYRWKMTDSQFPGATINSSEIVVNTNVQLALDNYAFQYKYDGRKRMTHKKVPGADWVYMVYDDRDRLVLTQDGEQRKNNKWLFTKYDALNRPVMTGMYTHGSAVDQPTMQTAVVNAYYSNLATNGGGWYETFSVDNSAHQGYDNKSFPNANTHQLTVTYYDNYDYRSRWGDDFKYATDGLSQLVASQNQTYTQPGNGEINLGVIGQVTGTKVRQLGTTPESDLWLRSINYYDDKYRVVQVISDNAQGGFDKTSNLYDFVGKVLQTKTSHHKGTLKWSWVSWTLATPNQVIKTGENNMGWNAGAFSEQFLPGGTAGEVKWIVSERNSWQLLGLSATNVGANYMWVDYGMMQGDDDVSIYEQGGQVAGFNDILSEGDVLKIVREGNGTTSYYHNTTLLYTSSHTTNEALHLQASIANQGNTIQNIRTSFAPEEEHTTLRIFTYDHAGRLLTTHHSVNGATPVLLAKNEYNELGQLIDKNLHSTDNGTTFKQSTDYRYNIRGWLTSINNAELTTGAGTGNEDDPNNGRDLFGMELAYEKPVSGLTTSTDVQYNGNISAIAYSKNIATGAIKSNGYKFTYDAMNRLQSSNFREKYATGWDVSQYLNGSNVLQHKEAFSETGFDYDLNGNIKKLNRSGQSSGASQVMDELDYSYEGNQLLGVKDNGDVLKGFVDGNVVGDDYTYDANGNMTVDKNKGITAITYSHLNLPDKVTKTTGEYLKYTYDATGRKLSQSVFSATGELKKKSDYAGEYFYENDTLKFINHEEGRVVVMDLNREENKDVIYHNAGSTLTGLAGDGATAALVVIDSRNYIKVTNTCAGECNGAGIKLDNISTETGETYRVRVKGYSAGGTVIPQIMLRGNGTSQYLSDGTRFPVGASSENWIEVTYTIQAGTTDMDVYFTWWLPSEGQILYIKEIELSRLKDLNANEYQYHLKDHLGNVRTTFTTKEEAEETTATLETQYENTERSQYVKYDDTRRVLSHLFDHTNGVNPSTTPGYSIRLNGSDNERNGIARSLSVMPGDKIDMQVFGKYYDPNTPHTADAAAWSTLLGFIELVREAAQTVVVDGVGYTSGALRIPPATGVLTDPNESAAYPKAHLNWATFDRDWKFLDGGAKQLQGGAEDGTDVPFAEISMSIEIKEPGYVYIWLSNTSAQQRDVFFDDFKVLHTKSPIVQQDEYYPFGLSFNSYQRETSTPQNFLYQEKEWQQDLDLNLYDFEWRQYDPITVRTTTMDPHAEMYPVLSPYSWVANNPLSIVDPDGQDITSNAFATTYTGADAQNMFRQLQALSSSSNEDQGNPFYSFNSTTQIRREQMDKERAQAEADAQPGVFESMWNATKDFGSDLVTGELFSKAWGSVSNYVTDYPNSMMKNLEYQYKLGQGELPANQVAYDFTYGAWSFATLRGAGKAVGQINPFGLRGGYGVFGKNGLRIGNYKLEMLYENGGPGGGTIFSLRQMKQAGSTFRWDYGRIHGSTTMGFHSTIRYTWNGIQYGSTAQRTWYPSMLRHPFFKPLKR